MSVVPASLPDLHEEIGPVTSPGVGDISERVIVLSTLLDHPIFEPQAATLASLDGYCITLHRFFDGERVEVFELSGIEVDRLMRAYRLHLRRLRRQAVLREATA